MNDCDKQLLTSLGEAIRVRLSVLANESMRMGGNADEIDLQIAQLKAEIPALRMHRELLEILLTGNLPNITQSEPTTDYFRQMFAKQTP